MLVALLLALNLLELAGSAHVSGAEWTAALPSSALLIAPLLWRRSQPLLVLLLVVSGYAAQFYAVGYYDSAAIVIAWLVAVYSLTAHAPRLHVAAGLPVGLVPIWVFLSVDPARSFADLGPAELLTFLAPAAAGWGVRRVRRAAELAEERAAERERTAEVEAELAVALERAHIARELHDVIAHSLSVIVMQAEAADALLDTDVGRARQSLRAIQRTGRDALTELRQVLGLLRTTDSVSERTPEPSLARLPALLAEVGAAGLAAELTVTGSPRPLPPGVERCAFRVVQEGLTNALKHADGERAHVAVRYLDDALEVEVLDTGTSALTAGGGYGLVGIRERVAVYGGSVDASPVPGGGFALRVRLGIGSAT